MAKKRKLQDWNWARSLLIVTLNNAIIVNFVKAKIDYTQDKCSFCVNNKDHEKSKPIVSEYHQIKQMGQNEAWKSGKDDPQGIVLAINIRPYYRMVFAKVKFS